MDSVAIVKGKLCARCHGPNDSASSSTCSSCKRLAARERYARWRKANPKKCTTCGVTLEGGGRHRVCRDCSAKTHQAKATADYWQAAEKGLCTNCKKRPAKQNRRTCEVCLSVRRDRARKRWQDQKDKYLPLVLNHYGAKCACCGEDEPLFLTIDHVNRDGAKKRREVEGGPSNTARYIVEAGYPSDYRILCYNCNCGRERNGGICPHEVKGASTCA